MTSEEAKEIVAEHLSKSLGERTAGCIERERYKEAKGFLEGMRSAEVKTVMAYASHTYHCDIKGGPRCDCGYAEALALYEKAVKL